MSHLSLDFQSFDFRLSWFQFREGVMPSSAMILPALWHLILVLTPLALSDNNPNNTVSWFTNGQNNINFAGLLCSPHNCQIVSENVKFLTRRGGFTQISGLDLNFICRICHPRVKAQPIVCESFCLRQFENFKIGRKKAAKILNSVKARTQRRQEAFSQGLMQFS